MSGKKQAWFPAPRLPRTGVESHAHLNGRHFAEDLEAVLDRARQAGVARMGQVFLSPAAYREGRQLFAAHRDVFFLLGIHPTDAHEYPLSVVEEIRSILEKDARVRAVGEIGLDYYWKDCPPETQKAMFIAQLRLARQCGAPVVLHCRDAVEDTLRILEEEEMRGYPLLWHCFAGTVGLARTIVDNGWHLSIPGPVTYPANQELRDAVAAVPEERLLVETDCPYLSPVPLRGKRNEPANLGYTIAAMARARNCAPDVLWTACGRNAAAFFGLEPIDPSCPEGVEPSP